MALTIFIAGELREQRDSAPARRVDVGRMEQCVQTVRLSAFGTVRRRMLNGKSSLSSVFLPTMRSPNSSLRS